MFAGAPSHARDVRLQLVSDGVPAVPARLLQGLAAAPTVIAEQATRKKVALFCTTFSAVLTWFISTSTELPPHPVATAFWRQLRSDSTIIRLLKLYDHLTNSELASDERLGFVMSLTKTMYSATRETADRSLPQRVQAHAQHAHSLLASPLVQQLALQSLPEPARSPVAGADAEKRATSSAASMHSRTSCTKLSTPAL